MASGLASPPVPSGPVDVAHWETTGGDMGVEIVRGKGDIWERGHRRVKMGGTLGGTGDSQGACWLCSQMAARRRCCSAGLRFCSKGQSDSGAQQSLLFEAPEALLQAARRGQLTRGHT